MKKQVSRKISFLGGFAFRNRAGGIALLILGILYSLKSSFFPEEKPYLEKDRHYLENVLHEALGLPDVIETSSKVPKIAFIDQVISHRLINFLPSHQLDAGCYDTLDYKDHVIPTFFKKSELIFIPEKEEEHNHCLLMALGFLTVAGEGDHQIYLPSNSPEPIEDKFVVPYPQWKKVIKRLEREKFDIINCSYSYGGDIYPHESYEAIKRGALVIVSAGNEFNKSKQLYQRNYTKLYQLAREMNTQYFEGGMLVAGAYNPFSDDLIEYSNRPFEGNSETSEDFVAAPCFFIEGNRAYMNGGTSIAAAYVSAVAALLMKKFPHFKGHHIAFIIKKSAQGKNRLINYKKAVEIGELLTEELNLTPPQSLKSIQNFFNYQ